MKAFLKKYTRVLAYLMVLLCFIVTGIFCEAGQEYYGVWSILPPVMMFVFALTTKSIIEGFFWGGLLAVFIPNKANFFTAYNDGIMGTIANEDNVYLILIFLYIGVFIALLKKSGAAAYFANWIAAKTKSPKLVLLISWLLGLGLSVDEYMSAFTIGASMAPVNDRYKIPREMSAYVVRAATVSPACLHPIGPWAIFISTILASIGFAPEGQGMREYMKVVPFLFFNFAVLLVSLLVVLGVIPKFGKMKKAYDRVEKGGPAAPPVNNPSLEGEEAEELAEPRKGVNLLSFIIPIGGLIAAAFFFEFNMVYGIMAAVIIMAVLYIIQGIFTMGEIVSLVFDGIRDLVELTVFLVIGITLADAVTALGFSDFVVGAIEQFMSPQMLPFVIFIAFAITEYLVTFNWTLYLIALPTVIALAQSLGTNVYLAIAALICAGVWGSNASFSSDGGIIVASSCGIDLYEHNMSQLPYMVMAAVLAALGFLVTGFVLG